MQFRLVVRVGQLGVQVEVEVRVVLDLLVPEPDGLALLDQDSAKKWVQNRFHVLVKVLYKENLTPRDTPNEERKKRFYSIISSF